MIDGPDASLAGIEPEGCQTNLSRLSISYRDNIPPLLLDPEVVNHLSSLEPSDAAAEKVVDLFDRLAQSGIDTSACATRDLLKASILGAKTVDDIPSLTEIVFRERIDTAHQLDPEGEKILGAAGTTDTAASAFINTRLNRIDDSFWKLEAPDGKALRLVDVQGLGSVTESKWLFVAAHQEGPYSSSTELLPDSTFSNYKVSIPYDSPGQLHQIQNQLLPVLMEDPETRVFLRQLKILNPNNQAAIPETGIAMHLYASNLQDTKQLVDRINQIGDALNSSVPNVDLPQAGFQRDRFSFSKPEGGQHRWHVDAEIEVGIRKANDIPFQEPISGDVLRSIETELGLERGSLFMDERLNALSLRSGSQGDMSIQMILSAGPDFAVRRPEEAFGQYTARNALRALDEKYGSKAASISEVFTQHLGHDAVSLQVIRLNEVTQLRMYCFNSFEGVIELQSDGTARFNTHYESVELGPVNIDYDSDGRFVLKGEFADVKDFWLTRINEISYEQISVVRAEASPTGSHSD